MAYEGPRCPTCGAASQCGKDGTPRVLVKQPPIFGEHPRRRAKALKIRQRNLRGGRK